MTQDEKNKIEARIAHLESTRIWHLRTAQEHNFEYARRRAWVKVEEIDSELATLRAQLEKE